MNNFLIGSQYFFKDIDGFNSKDIDYLELIDNPTTFKYYWQFSGKGKCYFKWKRMSAKEFIDVTLEIQIPMAIGKFLIPEFNSEIGFTIDHLKQLQPLVDKLDERHLYEKSIYESYIENNSFILSDKQKLDAYEIYKLYRK